MPLRRPPSPEELTPAAAREVALRLLAGRELTSAELRVRLVRRGFPADVVADVLARLADEGTLDDARAARARARHEAVIKRHGRARALQQVQALGVDWDTARRAVADAFEEVDEEALLAAALDRRLRSGPVPTDPAARRRLESWLLRQGFDPDAIRKALAARRP